MLDLGSPFFVRTEKESHSLNRESERKVMGIYECFYRLNIDSIFAYFVLLLFLVSLLSNVFLDDIFREKQLRKINFPYIKV